MEGGEPVFRYLNQTADYQLAKQEGFQGYPAFNRAEDEHRKGILEAFVRRLPSRKRRDFAEYLEKYRLPPDFQGSDLALLGYTGAKLPGDGFELCPDLTTAPLPLETVMEVAGFWRQGVPQNELQVGDGVRFVPEPFNDADKMAVAIHWSGKKIGYVPRPMLPSVHRWLDAGSIEAHIDRLNGKPDRPLVYLFVAVTQRG
ncbi:HIRAN domain-containing protein [Paraburkholderia fungorum]|uniref:HIRAN domain-containing protein n=1 Tax=Paraburkholderia fungorum TaxID=134537 RepID=UPI0038B6E8E3